MKPVNYLFELSVWVFALIALAFVNPASHHYTLCPLANLGFSWCPGCGLGRSIACILHGNFGLSFEYHWFGVPATLFLLHRTWQLSKKCLVYFGHKPT
ncbi:DUF2752 domain-containing protein [Arcticibacter tournemirensis]|uniref:DUF2752 domain-containing protein n=1 Tax=Arcticibacter tournemirensis TaxID=699437 RepID=A0A4Q0MF50_9SPHI|nr:DUF2752 domain-containing protein [Arcticibacter tournemirensis]RXF71904.1 DUF2752 domain-containing protein [Arcticibacter tournemirensis]